MSVVVKYMTLPTCVAVGHVTTNVALFCEARCRGISVDVAKFAAEVFFESWCKYCLDKNSPSVLFYST